MVLTWYFLLKTILVLILAARHPTVSQRKQLTPILPDQCHYFAWMLCISCVISVYFAHCYDVWMVQCWLLLRTLEQSSLCLCSSVPSERESATDWDTTLHYEHIERLEGTFLRRGPRLASTDGF